MHVCTRPRPRARLPTHTHTDQYVILTAFSTVTMVSWRRLNVTLYVHCLSCSLCGYAVFVLRSCVMSRTGDRVLGEELRIETCSRRGSVLSPPAPHLSCSPQWHISYPSQSPTGWLKKREIDRAKDLHLTWNMFGRFWRRKGIVVRKFS
jgi:hypothetical protein